MKYTGQLNPDDVLEVDTDKAEVMLNGQEIYTYSGSMITVEPNTTTISYTDSEASRDLELTMEFQERYG